MVTWKRLRLTGGGIEERWTAVVMKRANSDAKSNSDEDLSNSDEYVNREEEMEKDVPPVPSSKVTVPA